MKFYKNQNFWIATIGISVGAFLGIWAAKNFDLFKLVEELERIASWLY